MFNVLLARNVYVYSGASGALQIALYKFDYYFFRPLAQSRKLNFVLSEEWLQRRLIGVRSVEEGDRISPLEGYWQLLKQKRGFSGFASDLCGPSASDSRYLLFLWQLGRRCACWPVQRTWRFCWPLPGFAAAPASVAVSPTCDSAYYYYLFIYNYYQQRRSRQHFQPKQYRYD